MWSFLAKLVLAGKGCGERGQILTRRGRQKGSSLLASNSSGSKATNLLGRWSLYDGAFKCVHRESEEAVWALGCSLIELLFLMNGHI